MTMQSRYSTGAVFGKRQLTPLQRLLFTRRELVDVARPITFASPPTAREAGIWRDHLKRVECPKKTPEELDACHAETDCVCRGLIEQACAKQQQLPCNRGYNCECAAMLPQQECDDWLDWDETTHFEARWALAYVAVIVAIATLCFLYLTH